MVKKPAQLVTLYGDDSPESLGVIASVIKGILSAGFSSIHKAGQAVRDRRAQAAAQAVRNDQTKISILSMVAKQKQDRQKLAVVAGLGAGALILAAMAVKK